jgi:3-hydroxyacyl-CoA dehydrogenase/enoyl-CoA hydratase/3-hydroxybutyryl-CoA epimerase/enoyl-CoA isomerase
MRMLFQGKAFSCFCDDEKIVHLKFDLQDEKVNKFNVVALKEIETCVELVAKEAKAKTVSGLIFYSGKNDFIMGADITEFKGHFKNTDEDLKKWLKAINASFSAFEDLPIPTVAAIQGYALGGGCEITLAMTYRIATSKSKIGLPETKLGIIPGWGGTVRLPRLIGADNAIEWITGAKQYSAQEALKVGAIDGVVEVEGEKLVEAAKGMLKRALKEGPSALAWQERSAVKKAPLKLRPVESTMSFEVAKGLVAQAAGAHYPAPVKVVELMQVTSKMSRDEAIAKEGELFIQMAKTEVASSLIQVFLGDQQMKKIGKEWSKQGAKIQQAAVLGAGIMGGGIAYQSASSGVPILMKDIDQKQLKLGLDEATGLVGKLVSRHKMTPEKGFQVLNAIVPTLSYGDFIGVDIVVEAVVEREDVKGKVLAELETKVRPGTILTSNTSTISINKLAQNLKHPENFCGMHFFNPVHKMPLVEVIRGEKSSDAAIATTVANAMQMGKTPIVVKDCAGFLVNRILFPYFGGFSRLLESGVDMVRVDKVMEKFGWPMGPAYLLDVVGIDTAYHATSIMAAAYPDRMKDKEPEKAAISLLYKAKRFGQKNGVGFYQYEKDKKGFLVKKPSANLMEVIGSVSANAGSKGASVTDEEIVDRMMIPMIFETIRCLEDKIVATPIEADMGLLLGIGFPPFRAGALKYTDVIGAKTLVEKSKKYVELGPLYKAPALLEKMAAEGTKFYA